MEEAGPEAWNHSKAELRPGLGGAGSLSGSGPSPFPPPRNRSDQPGGQDSHCWGAAVGHRGSIFLRREPKAFQNCPSAPRGCWARTQTPQGERCPGPTGKTLLEHTSGCSDSNPAGARPPLQKVKSEERKGGDWGGGWWLRGVVEESDGSQNAQEGSQRVAVMELGKGAARIAGWGAPRRDAGRAGGGREVTLEVPLRHPGEGVEKEAD